MEIVIAFGANLGDRIQTFDSAFKEIEGRIGKVLKKSALYFTEPVTLSGCSTAQQTYLNATLLVQTKLAPSEIIETLLQIEKKLGRNRSTEKEKWGARIVDLDIISYENQIVENPNLKIPHPQMHKRRFVLQPMSEICPNWIHPELNKSVIEMLHDIASSSHPTTSQQKAF